MAITSVGFGATIVLGGIDDSTREINLEFDDTVADYAGAVTALNAHLAALPGVSAGVVKSYIIRSKAVEDAYNRPNDVDSEGNDTAVLTTRIANNPVKFGNIFIPYPKIGIFVAAAGVGRKELNIANAALLTYLALWQTGKNTLSDGEKAGNAVKGRRLS